ncbi:MAG: energy-coupling factor ABC transporter ATP-binding protein [Thermoleophilia bacterium]
MALPLDQERPEEPPVLRAEQLRYVYEGGHQALCGVDLEVHHGRRIALVGANGAGKTTLLLHLNGTLKPTSGVLSIDGEPVQYDRRWLKRLRATVGVVLQNPDDQLFAGAVYQDVSFGPLNLDLGEDEVRGRVEEALEAMDISGLRHRPTHMLSYGQKKRVAIAGAVAMHPQVLVLDEPMAGLDPSGAWQLMGLLRRLNEDGTSLVIATHDMGFAYEWAQEVAILSGGIMVAQGPPRGLMNDPAELAHYGLRIPWIVEVSELLTECGLLPAEVMPRTRDELRTALVAHLNGGGSAADVDDRQVPLAPSQL